MSTRQIQPVFSNFGCSSSIDVISCRAQELVEKINNSRAANQKVMESFQDKLVEKVHNLFYTHNYFHSPLIGTH